MGETSCNREAERPLSGGEQKRSEVLIRSEMKTIVWWNAEREV